MFRRLLLVALVAGVLPLGAGGAQIACAAEGPRAVLVVDTGSEGGAVHRYCVSLPAPQVSGIDLIKLAGEQHGLQYRLGHGGGAVCQLAGVGAEGDDCFGRYPDFWGYWKGDGSGGWSWSSSGAGSSSVRDGSVDGWSWGSGDSGSSHPKPPATSFGSVCPRAAPEPADDTADGGGEGSGSGGSAGGSKGGAKSGTGEGAGDPGDGATAEGTSETDDGVAAADPAPDRKDKRKKKKRTPRKTMPSPTPDVSASPDGVAVGGQEAPPVDDGADEGPPAAGLGAVAAALLLVGSGALISRRRKQPGTGSAGPEEQPGTGSG